VLNPSDGAKMAETARGGAAEIDAAVAAGHAARAGEWGKMDAVSRGRLMLELADFRQQLRRRRRRGIAVRRHEGVWPRS
jgi:acyl-CoA reductase-like NAD-dependent aldehyde dehydrogenase